MPRSDAYSQKVESPVARYVSWSSNEKSFVYYDKEKGKDVALKLPLTVVHLDEFGTIKGFHEKSNSSIYSNEIKSSKKEEFNVRSWKSPVSLAVGLYSQIKPTVTAIGGHYCVSIYVLIKGEIFNLSMKGSSLQHWSEFTKANRDKFLTHSIVIAGALNLKKGAIAYSVPDFQVGEALDSKLLQESDEKFDTLQAYFKARKSGGQIESVEAEEVIATPERFKDEPVQHEVDDVLPF